MVRKYSKFAAIGACAAGMAGCPSEVPDSSRFSTADAVLVSDGAGFDALTDAVTDTLADASGTDASIGPDATPGPDGNPSADLGAKTDAESDLGTQKQDIFTAGPDAAPKDVPLVDAGCKATGCPDGAPCHESKCQTDGTCSDTLLPDETPCGADKACHSGICLANPAKALRVVAGGETSCAILVGGNVQCWGAGDSGQLGNGSSGSGAFSATPVTVKGLTGATELACGASHCCALASGGSVWCWGDNQFGESNPASKSKQQVLAFQIGSLGQASAIGTGDHHTCAVVGQGTIRCWGLASSGQLGDGNSTLTDKIVDVDFAGSGYAMAVHGGGAFTCARTALAKAFCWGYNGYGQIGNGIGGTSQWAYKPAAVSGLSDVKALATGAEHACAVRNSGDVWCWGHASSGELGNGGGNSYYSQAVQAQGMAGAKAITAGGTHSCAIGAGDSVWCWGGNGSGQAGLGKSALQIKNPTQLADFDGVEIAAGSAHTCVRRADGSVWCWGANSLGQCGAGGGKDVFVPVKVW